MRVFDNGETVADHLVVGAPKGLVVSFNHYLSNDVFSEGFGQRLLLNRGYDVLTLKPRNNLWFQDLTLDDLRKLIQAMPKYREIISYGSSMGAYACLYFARVIRADRSVIVSPQISIDERLAPWDQRWAEQRKGIAFAHRPLSEVAHPQTRFYVLYDPLLADDRRHVHQIEASGVPLIHVKTPGSGHTALELLNELGIVSKTITSLIAGELSGEWLEQIRLGRKMTFTYVNSLAALTAAKKKRAARPLYEKAKEMAKTDWDRQRLDGVRRLLPEPAWAEPEGVVKR